MDEAPSRRLGRPEPASKAEKLRVRQPPKPDHRHGGPAGLTLPGEPVAEEVNAKEVRVLTRSAGYEGPNDLARAPFSPEVRKLTSAFAAVKAGRGTTEDGDVR